MGVVSPQPCIAVPRHLMGQRRRWAERTKAYPILRAPFSRSPADLCEPRAGRARGDRRRSMPSRSFSGADFFTAYQERPRPRWATRQRHARNVSRSGCVYVKRARNRAAMPGPNACMRREQRSRPAEGRGTQSASGWLDGRQASQPRPASLRWDGGRVLILGRGRGGPHCILRCGNRRGFSGQSAGTAQPSCRMPECAASGHAWLRGARSARHGRNGKWVQHGGRGLSWRLLFTKPREYPDGSRYIAMQQIMLPQCRGIATSSRF